MKKIIVELLEQYEKDMDMPQFAVQYYTDEYIISKHYGFIKWLVDNDKIDRDRVLISFTMSESDGLGNYYGHGVEGYQRILMLLAIQDEPIEFLISVLK